MRNGKGDSPRNIFSETFRSNFDRIDWGGKKTLNEIRLRVWDRKKGVFLMVPEILSELNSSNHPYSHSFISLTSRNGNLIWERYTGTEDLSGKDIYEGDIVSLRHGAASLDDDLWEVCWGKGPIQPGWYLKSRVSDRRFCLHSNFAERHVKIVGNIHE